MWRVSGLRFRCSSTESPELSGRLMSSRTALGTNCSARRRPSAAVVATKARNRCSRKMSRKMCANAWSSSMTRIDRSLGCKRPRSSSTAAGVGSGSGRAFGRRTGESAVRVGCSTFCKPFSTAAWSTFGMVRVKVLPLPSVLCTEMSPPKRLASSREMVRPRPVPP